MKLFSIKEIINKLPRSINAKITTSILAFLLIGFFIYYKMVSNNILEVTIKRSTLQEKSQNSQEKMVTQIVGLSSENLQLKEDNLRLRNKILINEAEFEFEKLNAIVATKLATTAQNTLEMIQSAMLDGNAPVLDAQLKALQSQEGILKVNLWRAENGHVGEQAFLDNYTIEKVNKNLGSSSFDKRTKEETRKLYNGKRLNMLKETLEEQSHQTMDGELDGLKATYLYISIKNREECQTCHGDDHPVRGILEIAISREEIITKRENAKKTMAVLEKKQKEQFANLEKTQKEEMENIKTQATALKNEMESDRKKIEIFEMKFGKKRFFISLFFIIALISSLTLLLRILIIKPVSEVVKRIHNISEGEGDLTKRLTITSRDEFGVLAQRFNTFIDKIHDIISMVKETSFKVNSSSSKISSAVEKESAISIQQAASVSEITSTMEDIYSNSTQIADYSHSVVEISSNALQTSQKGVGVVETVKNKMEQINQDNLNRINKIVELGKKTKEISKIMEIINNIADQTKLIAFNADIKASVAGEAGKQFTVVAVEIRRLADNVMNSVSMIESRIKEIQEAVNEMVIISEDGSKRIQEGVELSSQTVTVLKDILDGSQSVNESAKNISLSTQQQKNANRRVVTLLKEISEGEKRSSESMKQTYSITHSLTDLSDNLIKQVDRFKLKGNGNSVEDKK